jgi:hypothetical protein
MAIRLSLTWPSSSKTQASLAQAAIQGRHFTNPLRRALFCLPFGNDKCLKLAQPGRTDSRVIPPTSGQAVNTGLMGYAVVQGSFLLTGDVRSPVIVGWPHLITTSDSTSLCSFVVSLICC